MIGNVIKDTKDLLKKKRSFGLRTIDRLDKIMYGLKPGEQIVIAGETGSGKTTIGLDWFLENPLLDNYVNKRYNKFVVNLFSFEMRPQDLMLKLASKLLYKRHGIYYTPLQLRGYGASPSDYEKSLIDSLLDELFTVYADVNFYPDRLKPDEILNIIHSTAMEVGYNTSNGYRLHDYSTLVLNIVDHTRLLVSDNEFAATRELSTGLFECRNKYQHTNLIISQYNQNIEDPIRARSYYRAQLSDVFGDKSVTNDADYVFLISYPHRHNVANFLGYYIADRQLGDDIIPGLSNKYRLVSLEKSRWTDSHLDLHLFTDLGVSTVEALPSLDDIDDNGSSDEWYKLMAVPQEVYQVYRQKWAETQLTNQS